VVLLLCDFCTVRNFYLAGSAVYCGKLIGFFDFVGYCAIDCPCPEGTSCSRFEVEKCKNC